MYSFTAVSDGDPESRSPRRNRRTVALDTFVSGIVRDDEKEDFLNEYDCKPPPIFMILISLLEIIVVIVYAVELRDTEDPVTWRKGFPLYSPFVYKPTKRHEAWRFITYMLVHDGYSHLISNLFTQLVLGLPFEMAHEYWRVMILYMAGVLGGSLCHSVIDYDVNLVGASGGTFALLGAHLSSAIINWGQLNYKSCEGNLIRTACSGWVRLIFTVGLSALSFGVSIYERYFDDSNPGSKVGIAAHAGGLVAGLFLGLSVVKNRKVLPWENVVGKAFLILFIIIFIGAVFFNIFYEGYPPKE